MTEGQVTSQQWADFRHSIHSSNSHWGKLYTMKLANAKLHGGPHAYLIIEAAIEAAKSKRDWNYFRIPEIVDDICNCCPYKVDLMRKFITNTAPCIVKFTDYRADIRYLRMAIIYAYHKYHILDLPPASYGGFSGNGVPVPKDRILKVEFLTESINPD